MKLSPEIIDSSFRVSLSRETTKEEADALIEGITNVLRWKDR
jgi:cysteine sulfinate desulfinase/cysteine desulfurase-like protein